MPRKSPPPIWIYAPTHELAVRLAVHFRLIPGAEWLNASTLDKLRGTEYPIVIHCGCMKLPADTVEFLRYRYARILPLRCKHDSD